MAYLFGREALPPELKASLFNIFSVCYLRQLSALPLHAGVLHSGRSVLDEDGTEDLVQLTTGMDAGVSKLVGDVFHRYDVGLPIIGFMPWGFVNGRDQLARASGGVR